MWKSLSFFSCLRRWSTSHSIKESADVGLVDAQSGLLSEAGVVPHTLVQYGHDCGCLGDSAVDLQADGQKAGDSGPEMKFSTTSRVYPSITMLGGDSVP